MRNKTLQNRLIGKRLRKIRERSSVSRKEIAAQLEVSHQQIAKYELGINGITFQDIIEISKYLNTNILEFVVGDDEFDNLLKNSILANEMLHRWLGENKGDTFDLEEAFIVVQEYLKEARSFRVDGDNKNQNKHLYNLVCKTMGGNG